MKRKSKINSNNLDLLCRNYDFVVRQVRVHGICENDVLDISEEVMVAAVKSIGSLRSGDNIRPWLTTIVRYEACRYYRKRSRFAEVSSIIDLEEDRDIDIYDFIASEETVESILQEAERVDMVDTLLDSLPDTSRRVMRLRFWAGYRFSEISDILGVNVNTVKSSYRRGLEKLKAAAELLSGEDRKDG